MAVVGWVLCGQFYVRMSVQQHTGTSCRQLSGNGMCQKRYSHPCADWDVFLCMFCMALFLFTLQSL